MYIDDRVNQSAEPAAFGRALRRDDYVERPAYKVHSSTAGGSLTLPKPDISLPPCPKCGRTKAVKLEDLNCDCDAGFKVKRSLAQQPCQFPPGSEEKIAVMAARYRLGKRTLFQPGDRCEQFEGRLIDAATEFEEWDD